MPVVRRPSVAHVADGFRRSRRGTYLSDFTGGTRTAKEKIV